MNKQNHQDFELQSNYQKWLDESNIQVQSQLFKTATENVVAGWGCVATSFIKEGTILFEIPREACFTANEFSRGGHGDGSSSSEDDEDEADVDEAITSDTQKKLALKLLREMENSERDTRKVSKWKPFLDLLTSHPLPWTWPKSFREKVLLGTELEKVVEKKVERIRKEYKKITSSSAAATKGKSKKKSCMPNVTYQQYLRATSLVASHANPWFGVSIVPFNTTLNCPNVGDEANVEFDLVKKKIQLPLSGTASDATNTPSSNKSKRKGRNGTRKGNKNSKEKTITQVMIVGKAMADIQPGQELFQQYGDSVAELVYRCGFAPRRLEWTDGGEARSIDNRVDLKGNGKRIDCYDEIGVMEGDVVSLSIRHIVQCVEAVLKKNFNRDKGDNGVVITSLLPRMEALKQSGAIDESPWDGLNGWEYVTAEISMPSKSFMSADLKKNNTDYRSGNDNSKKRRRNDDTSGEQDRSVYDDGGISKLIGISLVLMANEEEWHRISTALKEAMKAKRSTHDSDDDDDDDESRSDDIAASSILASLANLNASQTQKLRQLALDVGQDDNDPWRALLLFVSKVKAINESKDFNSNIDEMRKKQKIENIDGNATPNATTNGLLWKLAFEAARLAIQKRMDVLLEGEKNCMSLLEELTRESQKQQSTSAILPFSGKKKDDLFEEEELNYEEKKDAIHTVQTLRNVEKSILLRAVEVLDDASTELIIEHDVIS